MNIKKKEENKLLGRIEVFADITFSGTTPSRDSIRKDISKEFKTDESLVIIKRINTIFGESKAIVEANIYHKDKALENIEAKHFVKRNQPKAEKVKIEEKKEEIKTEEKPKEKTTTEPTKTEETTTEEEKPKEETTEPTKTEETTTEEETKQ